VGTSIFRSGGGDDKIKARKKKSPHGSCFRGDIRRITEDNSFFRKVVYTGKYTQLVLMTLPPRGEIGEQEHRHSDQIMFITMGRGEIFLNGQPGPAIEDDVIFVPAGTLHNLANSGEHEFEAFRGLLPA
jgi:mannose-6-phosphate isomerase-like protein (cupin superfamily)